jgi:hypothetical protein
MKKASCLFVSVVVLLSGCNKTNPVGPTPQSSTKSIVAVTISQLYTEGNIGLFSIPEATAFPNLLSIYMDNDVRTYDGSTYVLERYGKDNIIKIKGSVIADSAVSYDKNIGSSVNVQDIAFISPTKAYITQNLSSQIAIFNPSTGDKSTKTIDCAGYVAYRNTDSAATSPYLSREMYYNGNVYVLCQRLKLGAGGFIQAADTSLILVVNATSDSVENTVKLAYRNPQEMSEYNGKLYVAGTGAYGANDGGIECIDLATGGNNGSIVDETALHGDVQSIIVIGDTKGYAVISTPSFAMEMYPFNPQTRTVGTKISGVDNPCSGHMAYDGSFVYIGDRSMTNPGIVVIDPATDTKVGSTKNIGLPPNSLAYLESK